MAPARSSVMCVDCVEGRDRATRAIVSPMLKRKLAGSYWHARTSSAYFTSARSRREMARRSPNDSELSGSSYTILTNFSSLSQRTQLRIKGCNSTWFPRAFRFCPLKPRRKIRGSIWTWRAWLLLKSARWLHVRWNCTFCVFARARA